MRRRGRPPHPDILTPREWEVRDLLRRGLTNRQIAQRLGIGFEGAKYHVSEIIGKLGATNRLEVAAWQVGARPWWAGVLAFVGWPLRKLSWAPALKIGGCLGLVASIGAFSDGAGVLMTDMDAAGNYDAYVVTEEGRIQLTDYPGSEIVTAWSPDCSRILFVKNAYGGGAHSEIWVMNADGSGQTRLTDTIGGWNPQWSPDGTRVLFIRHPFNPAEIWVMNADGTGQTQLTNTGGDGEDSWPQYSPDGRRILFVRNHLGNRDIYVMNADGTGETRLTSQRGYDGLPRWSPDGLLLAFVSETDRNPDIYVIGADGSGQRRLTSHLAVDGYPGWDGPRWSPDGRHIAFKSERDGNSEIYVMSPDGSAQTNLTNNPAFDRGPRWSPDSRSIAFASERAGSIGVYVMAADGSDVRYLGDGLWHEWWYCR